MSSRISRTVGAATGMASHPCARAMGIRIEETDDNKDARVASSSLTILADVGLGEDVVHHATVNVGQPEVAAAVAVGEFLVVNAQQVKNGGVEVMDVHGLIDGVHAEIVGGAVHHAALDAAAGQEHGEAGVVMI